jgi:hypothetical protein
MRTPAGLYRGRATALVRQTAGGSPHADMRDLADPSRRRSCSRFSSCSRIDLPGITCHRVNHKAYRCTIRRIVVTHDAAGRVLIEEAQNVSPFAVPDKPGMSTEDRDKLASLAALAFGSSRTTYTYGQEGRLVGRLQQMGLTAR